MRTTSIVRSTASIGPSSLDFLERLLGKPLGLRFDLDGRLRAGIVPALLTRPHERLDGHRPVHDDLAGQPKLPEPLHAFELVVFGRRHHLGLAVFELHTAGRTPGLSSATMANVDTGPGNRIYEALSFVDLERADAFDRYFGHEEYVLSGNFTSNQKRDLAGANQPPDSIFPYNHMGTSSAPSYSLLRNLSYLIRDFLIPSDPSMRHVFATLPLLSALLLVLPHSIAAQSPDSAAVDRLRGLVTLLDTTGLDGRARVREYVRAHYAPDFRDHFPMGLHVDYLLRLVDQTRGLDVQEMQDVSPTQATALLRTRLTGDWLALRIEVEDAPPHRITRIDRLPPSVPATLQARTPLSKREIAQQLDAYVRKLAGADVFSGVVLLARGGQPLYAAAFGHANKDFAVPNHLDTRFNLGSMNKMFTAVAIVQLVQQGRLSFDDPLSDYLPDFPSPEAAAQIQIKHLLTHTSGLGSYFNETFQEGARSHFRTVDDFMQLAEGDSLRFAPGTDWSYSNTGFLVLGKVIEVVTDSSYFDVVEEHVYRPAGMLHSGSFDLDRVNPNLAVGYDKQYTDEGVRYRNNLFEHVVKGGPAGGGYATANDLLRFAASLQDSTLLTPAYVDTLLSPKPELSSPDYGYGFGVQTEGPLGRRAGHSGGFVGISSNLDLFLNRGYTAVVLSNYSGASTPIVHKMRELIERAK